jgi:nucleotide-binding universal stress UspA family protein
VDTSGATQTSVFDGIVCGVDGTPESLFAVKQARRLQGPDGSLLLVAAAHLAKAVHAGMVAPHAAQRLRDEAAEAMAEAKALGTATGRIVNGEPASVLLSEAEHATLLALGSHGRRRAEGHSTRHRREKDAARGALFGSDRPPGSRPGDVAAGDRRGRGWFGRVGGRRRRGPFGGELLPRPRIVLATSDRVDRDIALTIAPELEEQNGRAVGVLKAQSVTADLVVVGSRGLQGLKALGSVSERVAHQAKCSVLVVRDATPR